ncbi:MAG: cupin-like domain-containing protein [Kofleriaceae bacterium]
MKHSTQPVDRRSGLTRATFHAEYLVPERPVVLDDQIQSWGAMTRWEPAELVRRFGDRPIRGYTHPEGLYTAWKRFRVDTTFGAVLTSPDPRLFAACDFLPECPYLMEDIGLPDVLAPEWIVDEATLWLQPRGNRTGLHWDTYNSIISVVRGEKRVLLFAPTDWQHLYPCTVTGSADWTRGSWSSVDIFAPDYETCPGVRDATCTEVTLRAGETLLIPRHWWHAVENLGTPTLAVSFFAAGQGKPEPAFFVDRRVIGGFAYQLGLAGH